MGSLTVYNALISTYTHTANDNINLTVYRPFGNVSVVSRANVDSFVLTINSLLDGTRKSISACPTARVFYNDTNVKNTSKYITVSLTNGAGAVALPYLTYYWVEVYNYAGGSWTQCASGQILAADYSINVNYYSVTVNRGNLLSSATASNSPVLSGTTVTFKGVSGSESGYTYSNTVTWTTTTGNLGTFTSTSNQTVSKAITAKTVINANTTRTINSYTVTVVDWNMSDIRINGSAVSSKSVQYLSTVNLSYSVSGDDREFVGIVSPDFNSWSSKSDTGASFTMPAKNVTVYVASCGIDGVDSYSMTYESKALSSYSGSSLKLPYTASDFSIDYYEHLYEAQTYNGYWYLCTGNGEGTEDDLNIYWHGLSWMIHCLVYTIYNVSIVGDGHCSASPSLVSVRRQLGRVNSTISFNSGYEYSSVQGVGCTVSRSGNTLTISNVTSPTAKVTLYSTTSNYTLGIQVKIDGSNRTFSGAKFRVYTNSSNSKPSAYTEVSCNSSGKATIAVPYLSYYWIEAYEYIGGSFIQFTYGRQPLNGTTEYAYYYTISIEENGNIEWSEVSHNMVLGGTYVKFRAAHSNESGYEYSDTITWTGTLGTFTSQNNAWSASQPVNQTVVQTVYGTKNKKSYPLIVQTYTGDCDIEAITDVNYVRIFTSTSSTMPATYTDVLLSNGEGSINIPFENHVWVYAYNPSTEYEYYTDFVKEPEEEIIGIRYNYLDVWANTGVSSVEKSAEYILKGSTARIRAYKASAAGYDISNTVTWEGSITVGPSQSGAWITITEPGYEESLWFTASCQKTPKQYTATFYNGSTVYDRKTATYNERFTTARAPDKPGYVFIGWEDTHGHTWGAGVSFIWTDTTDVTFNASWGEQFNSIYTHSLIDGLYLTGNGTSIKPSQSKSIQIKMESLIDGYECISCSIGSEIELGLVNETPGYFGSYPEGILVSYHNGKLYVTPNANNFNTKYDIWAVNDCGEPEECYSHFRIYLVKNGPYAIRLTGTATVSPTSGLYVNDSITVSNVTSDEVSITLADSTCLIEGTKIRMADGTEQPIETIKENDKLMSFNPYTNEFCSTTVLAILPAQEVDEYNKITFEDGSEVCTAHGHGFFNKDTMHGFDLGGDPTRTINAITINGTAHNISVEKVQEHVKIYSIITSLGMYFSNGILSCHRALQKYNVLGSRYANYPEEVQNVILADYNDYMKFLKYKYTSEYAEARKKFEDRRAYYNGQIFTELQKLGVDIWEELRTTKKYTGYRLELIKKYYDQYKGQSETLDRLYQKRIVLEHNYYLDICRIQGVVDGHNAPAELFERCFKRDLAVEHLL